MLRIVIDTSVWLRILLRGRIYLPILYAWEMGQFLLITSPALLDEYSAVWQRPRFHGKIDPTQATRLFR